MNTAEAKIRHKKRRNGRSDRNCMKADVKTFCAVISFISVLYTRAPRLLQELHVAHGDGSLGKRLAQLARLDLLILDDFGIAPIAAHERNDLLELLDDRVGTRSTLITSQLPVTAWHAWLDEPTLSDAILDRIVHGSHKIALKGESMRKLTKAV